MHLNDITLITPVFHEGTLFGYVANIAHHVDVGGGAPGSIGVSSEIYQEGLVIPPVRFVKGGQIDRDLFAMIRSNFRGTREISGDFRAQTAANRLGAQRIEALAAQHGAPTLTHYLDELLRYTERRTRAAFAEFPDGRFTADMLMDGDGVTDQPVRLEATVTIERGRVSVDLTGCDDQRKSPTNATSSQTYSGVVYVLKCLIDPDIPVNDGFYRLIDIRSRPGSVVHAQHPGRGGRGLGDRHAALRPAVQGARPRAARPRGGGHEGLRVQHRLRRHEPGAPASTSRTTRPSRAATGPRSPPTAWTRCRRTSRTPRTRRSRRPRPTTRCASCATRSSRTRRAAAGTAAGLGVRRDYAFPGHAPSFSILSDKARYAPWGLFGGGAARPARSTS